MPAQIRSSRSPRLGKALPILLLSASCALYACANRNAAPAAPADPNREHSQGTPLQSSPSVSEQRINEPTQQAYGQTQTPPAQHPPTAQAPPQERAAPAQSGSSYIVLQPGETLSYISALYAVSEKNLIAWNGLQSAHDVRAGQRLRIQPTYTRDAASASAPVAEGRHTQRPQQEAAHGATPATPDSDGMITVQHGQNLSGIAVRHKVSVTELRQWNKLKNDQLQTGQKLRVRAPVRVHTVKAGENIGGIAARYKVNAQSLARKNKLINADVLPVGKELILP